MVLKDQVPQNIRKNENVGVGHDLSPSHPSILIHERILDTLEMIEAFEGLNKMRWEERQGSKSKIFVGVFPLVLLVTNGIVRWTKKKKKALFSCMTMSLGLDQTLFELDKYLQHNVEFT